MSRFFKDFPNISYKLPYDPDTRNVVDVFGRFRFLEGIIKDINIFYDYRVKDGETPEIVSNTFYGTPDHHWIIMLFNKIYDVNHDWVMGYDIFEKYIENKYGSIPNAKQTVKYYYQDVSRKRVLSDGTIIPEIKNIITQDIYDTLDDQERSLIYCYDYEDQLNEKKRNIKIVDAIFIPQILNEKERVFL